MGFPFYSVAQAGLKPSNPPASATAVLRSQLYSIILRLYLTHEQFGYGPLFILTDISLPRDLYFFSLSSGAFEVAMLPGGKTPPVVRKTTKEIFLVRCAC